MTLDYTIKIYESEYIENQEIEEQDIADGLISESERKYSKPFSPNMYRAEINATAYMIMLKTADLPTSPTVVFNKYLQEFSFLLDGR